MIIKTKDSLHDFSGANEIRFYCSALEECACDFYGSPEGVIAVNAHYRTPFPEWEYKVKTVALFLDARIAEKLVNSLTEALKAGQETFDVTEWYNKQQ